MKQCFDLLKKKFIGLLSASTTGHFGESLTSNFDGCIKCVSLNNQPGQATPSLININSNKSLYYPLTVSINIYGRSYNSIGDPNAPLYVPDRVKNMNEKGFNLILRLNETRFLIQHESCECKCGLNESVCNSKQKWNHNKFSCEYKELDGWRSCKDNYMWNPSTCNCEDNKACKIKEYLEIKNCSCKKRLFGKLVLAFEDEILNTTETSLVNKKVSREKIIILFIVFNWRLQLIISCNSIIFITININNWINNTHYLLI